MNFKTIITSHNKLENHTKSGDILQKRGVKYYFSKDIASCIQLTKTLILFEKSISLLTI